MVQRDADLDAAVLEREHVLDVVARAELLVAVGPDVEQQLEVPQRQRPERRRRVLREHDDLADARAGPRVGTIERAADRAPASVKRRKEVLEHRDVPAARRHFGRVRRIGRRRERVVLRRRQERPVLPMAA